MQMQSLYANPVLPAIAGMFVVSLLDAGGVVDAESPLELALVYGVFGACGGLLAYALLRRWRD